MSKETPLHNWHFLIGEWNGGSKDQFGGDGETKVKTVFSLELNGKYIMSKHEAVRNDKLENASIGLMFYDARNKLVLRKTFFNYGFVNNEVEYERTDTEIRFEVELEPVPQSFDGMRWRSYILKISDTEIRLGLEAAKEGKNFTSYGETILQKFK